MEKSNHCNLFVSIIVFSLQFQLRINDVSSLLFLYVLTPRQYIETWATFHSDEDANTLMTSKLSDLYTVKIQKKKLRRGLKVMLV